MNETVEARTNSTFNVVYSYLAIPIGNRNCLSNNLCFNSKYFKGAGRYHFFPVLKQSCRFAKS